MVTKNEFSVRIGFGVAVFGGEGGSGKRFTGGDVGEGFTVEEIEGFGGVFGYVCASRVAIVTGRGGFLVGVRVGGGGVAAVDCFVVFGFESTFFAVLWLRCSAFGGISSFVAFAPFFGFADVMDKFPLVFWAVFFHGVVAEAADGSFEDVFYFGAEVGFVFAGP